MKLQLVQSFPAAKRMDLLLLFVIPRGGLRSPIEQALLGAQKAPAKLCFFLTSTWLKGRTSNHGLRTEGLPPPPTLAGFHKHFFLPRMMHLEFYPLPHAK